MKSSRTALFLLVFFTVLTNFSWAQSTFALHYGGTGVEGGKCLVKDYGGNLIIGGYKGDSSLIMRVTPGGTVLSQFTFRGLPGGAVENIVHMIVDRDSNLVGVGQARTNFFTFVFKFDLVNNVMLWVRGTPISADYGYVAEFPGIDDYFVVGDNKYNSSPGLAIDASLMRIDRNTGAMTTLNRNYNLGSAETFSYIVNINDTLFMSGRNNKYGGGTQGMRHALTATDLNGNFLYSRMYFVPVTTTARMYHGAVAVDGDSLVLGCLGNASGTATNWNIHITKVDHAGQNSWAKQYAVQGYSQAILRHLEVTPTGYLAAGFTSIGNRDFLLFELDKTGNVVWAKRYGGPGNENMGPAGAMLIDNAYIYFTGTSAIPGNSDDIVLVKVNLNGEFDGSCGYATNQVITPTSYPTLYNGPENLTVFTRSHNLLAPFSVFSATSQASDTICWAGPLAVEFLHFDAQWASGEKEEVNLFWSVADVSQVARFEVESFQGEEFISLAEVDPAAAETSRGDFQISLPEPRQDELLQYRLRSVDWEGVSSFSELVTLRQDALSGLSLKVVSGDVSERLVGFYSSAEGGWADLEVVSVLGAQILSREVWLETGGGRFEIGFPVPAGVYVAQLRDRSTGQTAATRFVVR